MNKLLIHFCFVLVLSASNIDPNLGTEQVTGTTFLINSDAWTLSYFWDKDHEETDGFIG